MDQHSTPLPPLCAHVLAPPDFGLPHPLASSLIHPLPQINERLARFTVRHGMAGFVKSMVPEVQRFVAERRQRCSPEQEDPQCYGARAPLRAAYLSSASSASSLGAGGLTDSAWSASASEAGADDSASERAAGGSSRMQRSSSLRRLGYMVVASGVAIAIARTASGGPAPASSSGGGGSSDGKASREGGGHHSHNKHGHNHAHNKHAPKRGNHGGKRRHTRPALPAAPTSASE